jgi:hypothetical protein
MVDNARRKKLALHLRQYVSCRFSNNQFEKRIADDVSFGWLPEQYQDYAALDPDPVIPPMLEHIWSLYSDACFHSARGKYAIVGKERRRVARYILFLRSNLEYRWPAFRFAKFEINPVNWIRDIFSFGRTWRERRAKKQERWDEFKKSGDYNCWPFISREAFEAALKSPPYLAGRMTC